MHVWSTRRVTEEIQIVRQHRGNDCGPAVLATIAACYGVPVDLEVLTEELELEHDGIDLLALSRAAARLGFRTRGVRASYDAIAKCALPAIAHVSSGGSRHFVVVQRWSPSHVVISDPAVGVRRLSRKAFCRRATGYLLLVAPL